VVALIAATRIHPCVTLGASLRDTLGGVEHPQPLGFPAVGGGRNWKFWAVPDAVVPGVTLTTHEVAAHLAAGWSWRGSPRLGDQLNPVLDALSPS
jgi:hypothetical protein